MKKFPEFKDFLGKKYIDLNIFNKNIFLNLNYKKKKEQISRKCYVVFTRFDRQWISKPS